MIKLISFDCFGVLTQDTWLAFCEQFTDEELLERMRYLNHQSDRGLIGSEDEFLDKLSKLTDLTKTDLVDQLYGKHKINEKLFEYIKELKSVGYKIGLISNVAQSLDHYLPKDHLELFDEITESYKVGLIKPDRGIFIEHLEAVGVLAEEAVFVDDRDYNADGARRVGMEGLVYRNFTTFRKELEQIIDRS